MLLKLASVFFLAYNAIAQDTSLAEVRRSFSNANIPTDATITFDPTTLLEVSFPQASGPPVRVHAGVQLKRNQTAIPPTFAIRPPTINSPTSPGPFVVAMVDLDAPTPQMPNVSQIRHFLGGNFRGTQSLIQESLRNTTAALSEFQQPTPPAGSDPHRYVFLLFNQPRGFNSQTIITPASSIENFSISQFAQEVGLGRPLGGTFILVGPDPTTA